MNVTFGWISIISLTHLQQCAGGGVCVCTCVYGCMDGVGCVDYIYVGISSQNEVVRASRGHG